MVSADNNDALYLGLSVVLRTFAECHEGKGLPCCVHSSFRKIRKENYMEETEKVIEEVKNARENKRMQEKARKKLAEMNLLGDFLFGSVVTYPEIGERFVRILLKTIFGREFKYLSVAAQKVLYGTESDLHGARLDVYIEPEAKDSEGKVTVYDIEPDKKDSAADKRSLPRRVRFYHGKIIARSLNSGAGYDDLKNIVVIMVLPFDPFGLDRMVYTVKSRCVEVPEMEYEDGASTLFLYTKGTKGEPGEALKQMLHYMEYSNLQNAVNDDLKEVHRMVEVVKFDSETSISCVRLMEKLAKSKAEGELKGELKGKTEKLVTQICKKMKLGQSLEKIAEDLVEEVSAIEPIFTAAEKFAPAYEAEAVLQYLAGGPLVADQ